MVAFVVHFEVIFSLVLQLLNSYLVLLLELVEPLVDLLDQFIKLFNLDLVSKVTVYFVLMIVLCFQLIEL
jgi:hypothetical protein